MVKKKLYPVVKFTVRAPLHTYVKETITEDKILQAERIYKLWLASFDIGNIPFIILTNHIKELQLGDMEGTLRWLDAGELLKYFEDKGYPPEHVVKKLCKVFMIEPDIEEDEETKEKKIDVRKTMLKIINLNRFFKLTLPITDEYLQELLGNPEKLQKEIDFFITEKMKKDSRVYFWAKTCLPIVSDALEDYWIERYRGHTFVVKPPKTGFSYFAQKVGRCVGYASSASIRGFSDSQGNIRHGVIHANFGSIMLDEASHYKDIVADVALTFMELGKQEVTTAGLTLTNLGAPKLTITINAGQDVAKPRDFLEALDKMLPKLTTVPEAFGSRFGLIIFARKMQPVEMKEFVSQKEIKKNELVVRSIFEEASKYVKEIYAGYRIQEWLNKPLPEYEKQVRKLVDKLPEQYLFGQRVKIFWLDHAKSGYRHVRGVALEAALVDLIDRIIESKGIITEDLEDEILEKAEEYLQTVININLDSLREMINVTEETEPLLKELIQKRYKSVEQGYIKALIKLLAIAVKKEGFNPERYFVLEELSKYYDKLSDEEKKEFGARYAHGFSKIIQAIEKLKPSGLKNLQHKLETDFGIELSRSDTQKVWLLRVLSETIMLLDWDTRDTRDTDTGGNNTMGVSGVPSVPSVPKQGGVDDESS